MFASALTLLLSAATWVPGDVKPSPSLSSATLIQRIVPFDRTVRVDTYRLISGNANLVVTAALRGEDYRLDTDIGADHYAMGRSGGASWRRTPSGTSRIVWSDVQGDDLDRWPRAVFGFYTHDCDAVGKSSADPVLRCKAPGDVVHYYYIDRESGRIVREVTREGARIETYRFRIARDGSVLGWSISGEGGTASVERETTEPQSVPIAAVAIPQSVTGQFALPSSGRVRVPARFTPDYRIAVPVMVNGRQYTFALDTGTTQVLMDIGAAMRAGFRPVLGHFVATNVQVADAAAATLSVEAVDLFGGRAWDGILGNEFFTGHIVRIDYRDERLDLISHAAFKPPAGALEVPIYTDEGMPIVQALFNGVQADRVALDSAGPSMVSSDFQERARLQFGVCQASRELNYLEGGVRAANCDLKRLDFASYAILDVECRVEQPDSSNLDIPLDAIIGYPELSHFDLYFDYDDNELWIAR